MSDAILALWKPARELAMSGSGGSMRSQRSAIFCLAIRLFSIGKLTTVTELQQRNWFNNSVVGNQIAPKKEGQVPDAPRTPPTVQRIG